MDDPDDGDADRRHMTIQYERGITQPVKGMGCAFLYWKRE